MEDPIKHLIRWLDLSLGLMRWAAGALGPAGGPVKYLSDGIRYRVGLARSPRVMVPARWMAAGTRSSRNLNELMAHRSAVRYLEIGVRDGATLEAVRSAHSVGVDPVPQIRAGVPTPRGIELHRVASDAYFAALEAIGSQASFDVVFVDGLHEFRQAYRDIVNALWRLRPGGLVLIDDVVPASIEAAGPDIAGHGPWMGDVFRAVLALVPQADVLDWRTFERPPGRFQTALWKIGQWVGPVPEKLLAELSSREFVDVFRDGVPPEFRPCSFDMAVEAYRNSTLLSAS